MARILVVEDNPANMKLAALLLETKSGRQAVRGQVFIDCSGDGDLATWAGAPFEKGRDAAGQGEDMMYPSTMFRINGVDPAKAGDAYNHFGRWMEQAEKDGYRFARKMPIIRPQKNPAEWRANVTQLANADGSPVDGTNALQLSAAEIEELDTAVRVIEVHGQRLPDGVLAFSGAESAPKQ